ncbi:hypothetical protein ACTFIY_009554 [Dictyostelium cf. discoideum]
MFLLQICLSCSLILLEQNGPSINQKHFNINQTAILKTTTTITPTITPTNQPLETYPCRNGSSAFSRKIAEIATNNQDNRIDNITVLFGEYKVKNVDADTFLENMPIFDAISLEYIGRLNRKRINVNNSPTNQLQKGYFTI